MARSPSEAQAYEAIRGLPHKMDLLITAVTDLRDAVLQNKAATLTAGELHAGGLEDLADAVRQLSNVAENRPRPHSV